MKTLSSIYTTLCALILFSCNESTTNPKQEFNFPEFERIGAISVPRLSDFLTYYHSEIFVVMNDIDQNSYGYLTKSTDGGFNWNLVKSFDNNIRDFGGITNGLYMIRGASYFLSFDKGSTWIESLNIPDANMITSCFFSQDGFIYFSTDRGIFKTKDDGTELVKISDSNFFQCISGNEDDGSLYAID